MRASAIRSRVLKLLRKPADVQHLGLRWDRFNPSQDDVDDRVAFLASFESFPEPVLAHYRTAFAVRKDLIETRGGLTKTWNASGRICFGAGDKGVLEVGIRFHHTYGVPVIPGSAQKGLVLRQARRASLQSEDLLGKGGDTGWAGAVTFHDALWEPGPQPFDVDTITVHHPEYYKGQKPPADWDSPNPIGTLSARGRFLFAVEGAPSSCALAMRLLGGALRDEGIGARTLKGYGRFDVPSDDVVPPPRAQKPLFEFAPGSDQGSAASTRMLRAEPATAHVDGHALVSFQPNSGRFEVTVTHDQKRMRAPTGPSPIVLFTGDSDEQRRSAMETLQARCRKKDAVAARVTYEAQGSSLTIKHIEPLT